ncbi:MAG: pyridoxal-phosphate dependent enzyme [Bacteroidia bacterium]|nr:pyridoxal-phosphate dependent enzyme [Bacteroidia bacterium]
MFSAQPTNKPNTVQISHPSIKKAGVELFIKRLDLPDPISMGNKGYKLKHNLIEAKNQGLDTILTFGGAYSNHIVATAAICNKEGLKSIGIIRGNEIEVLNPSLNYANEQGMKLHFVSREEYRNKENKNFIDALTERFGSFYMVHEGGSNKLGVKGCMEILESEDAIYDTIAVACGTGTTLAGIVSSLNENQNAIGVAVLNAQDYLEKNVLKYIPEKRKTQFEIINDFHFGGYAKSNDELNNFVESFNAQSGIEIEPIYTGKLIYAITEMIKNGRLKPNTKVLAIHTGGLQYIKLK